MSAQTYALEALPGTISDHVPGGSAGKLELFCANTPSEALRDAWMVIEAVPEELTLKHKVLAELSVGAPPDAIIASNSSSFSGRELASAVPKSHQSQFLNTHYYLPPDMNLLELMPNPATDAALVPFLHRVAAEHGLRPIEVKKDSIGLIVNRIWAAIKRESLMVAAEGVSTPQDIDAALSSFLPGVAPFALMDKVGLATVGNIQRHYQSVYPHLAAQYEPVLPYVDTYTTRGALGWQSDEGFYNYTPLDQQIHILALDVLRGYAARRSLDGRQTTHIAEGLQLPDGVVALPDGSVVVGCMGATEGGNNGYIVRAWPVKGDTGAVTGWDVKTIVPEGVTWTPKQVTIDAQAEKLYWSDREGGRVWRASYDGSSPEVLFQTVPDVGPRPIPDATKHCVGCAVDSKNGWVYWTLKGPPRGGQGRICRAPLERGSAHPAERTDVEVLYDHLPEPIDLHVSKDGTQLWWTDRGVGALFSAQLSAVLTPSAQATATTPPVLLSDHFHQTIGLAVDERHGHIYVADLGGAVYRTNLAGKDKIRVRSTDANAYTGIALQLPETVSAGRQ